MSTSKKISAAAASLPSVMTTPRSSMSSTATAPRRWPPPSGVPARAATCGSWSCAGAGEGAFIGGADIRAMVDLTPEASRPFITSIHGLCTAIRRAPVPVVARLSGYCLGAGLEIAVSCDLRVADTTARFGMPEVQVGLPSVIEAALLPRLVGWGRAARLVFTGETIGAEQAYDWGLVETLVPEGELDDALARTVDMICAAGPTAVRLQKELLRDWEELPLRDAVERSIDRLAEGFASGEPRERMRAFLGRRS